MAILKDKLLLVKLEQLKAGKCGINIPRSLESAVHQNYQ